MNRIRTAATFVLAFVASTGSALAEDTDASANLRQIKRSGVKAFIGFRDEGTTLEVSGIATGLDPDLVYVSFVYNAGSVPKGPTACLPNSASPPLSGSQMLLGYWLPLGSDVRYLVSVKSGPNYAPLSNIGTTSVRQDTMPDLPFPQTPTPARFVLKACGKVNIDKD